MSSSAGLLNANQKFLHTQNFGKFILLCIIYGVGLYLFSSSKTQIKCHVWSSAPDTFQIKFGSYLDFDNKMGDFQAASTLK